MCIYCTVRTLQISQRTVMGYGTVLYCTCTAHCTVQYCTVQYTIVYSTVTVQSHTVVVQYAVQYCSVIQSIGRSTVKFLIVSHIVLQYTTVGMTVSLRKLHGNLL